MIVPGPVQAAMTVALADDAHVAEQAARYRRRRDLLLGATAAAGLAHVGGDAGLYLWLRPADGRAVPSTAIVAALAERGILVAPGTFYGRAGEGHVRMALTATDERVRAAAERLTEDPALAYG